MIIKTFLVSLIIFFIATRCSNNKQSEKTGDETTAAEKNPAGDANVVKIYIEQDGDLTANGKSISLQELDASFSQLKSSNGMVYYSRENPDGDPPPEAMKVMDLLIKYNLPVKLYTDKTFSVLIKTD